MSNGIDYGMGKTNIDTETGIRYGVIPMQALAHWAWDEVEADYGPPTCPRCGGSVVEYDDYIHHTYTGRRCDYACDLCKRVYDSGDCYPDEPVAYTLVGDGIEAVVDDHGDMIIMKSPYYTTAKFCSPCAPGACYLLNYSKTGEKAYCLPHEWFEDDVADRNPYPVYSVKTGELVQPPEKK